MYIHPFTLDLVSNIVIVGQNYELADYNNPRGNIFGYAVQVVLVHPNGARDAHQHSFINRYEDTAIAEAQKFSDKISNSLYNGGTLNPGCWNSIEPVYGSDAYVSGGYEQDQCNREREDW